MSSLVIDSASAVQLSEKFENSYGSEFIEVETPMMQSVAGGAAARPLLPTSMPLIAISFCVLLLSST